MNEVAGILIAGAEFEFSLRSHGAQLHQKLLHIAHLARKPAEPFGAGDIIGMQFVGDVAVVLEHRATPGDVGDHRIDLGFVKLADVLFGEVHGRCIGPAVVVNRSAALL